MIELETFLPAAQEIDRTVGAALDEDIGSGDLTASLIDKNTQITAQLICREQAVLCGVAWFDRCCHLVDPEIDVSWRFADGETLTPDCVVCSLEGSARSILTAERTAINFLQTLSGVATQASRYVKAVEGTQARILDTRKTLPGLRLAQKYAVVAGGAHNHRIGLYDGVLLKENHIAATGSIANALAAARQAAPECDLLEIEVESLDQLDQALAANATRIMLDNFDLDMMREGVRRAAGRAEIEASGNVTMESLREIAETGVDYISVGALTKHLCAVDFSLRFSGA
ncbi:MAG: carboxylating nicotinate-nucleotide diphosphorylase [Arenicellales bacterium]